MGGKRIWKALKWFSRPIEWLRAGERQGVEGEIRQQKRKFINLKNLRYINKQNKITVTKEMTKCKGKEKQKKRREEKRKTSSALNRTPDLLHARVFHYYYAT